MSRRGAQSLLHGSGPVMEVQRMGEDAHAHVRRQRGRLITRLWALTSISTRVDSSAPFGA